MEKQLNTLETTKIEQFCADEVMFEAVKKVLFGVIYSDGVIEAGKPLNTKNGAFSVIANAYGKGEAISNDVLGASLRAKFEGVHTILEGFQVLKTIKTKVEEIPSPFNEAI